MKTSLVLILAGILCVLMVASGCTSTSSTTTAPPAATAAGPAESSSVATAPATPVSAPPSWSGTWNSTWLEKDGNQTISVLTLTQAGPDVTGTYRFTYPGEGTFTGSLNATVQGKSLAGTYAESDNDTGFFVFELSETKNSFTGRWVHAVNRTELDASKLSWNGVRQ